MAKIGLIGRPVDGFVLRPIGLQQFELGFSQGRRWPRAGGVSLIQSDHHRRRIGIVGVPQTRNHITNSGLHEGLYKTDHPFPVIRSCARATARRLGDQIGREFQSGNIPRIKLRRRTAASSRPSFDVDYLPDKITQTLPLHYDSSILDTLVLLMICWTICFD
jgi:hypothetical protein